MVNQISRGIVPMTIQAMDKTIDLFNQSNVNTQGESSMQLSHPGAQGKQVNESS